MSPFSSNSAYAKSSMEHWCDKALTMVCRPDYDGAIQHRFIAIVPSSSCHRIISIVPSYHRAIASSCHFRKCKYFWNIKYLNRKSVSLNSSKESSTLKPDPPTLPLPLMAGIIAVAVVVLCLLVSTACVIKRRRRRRRKGMIFLFNSG